MHLTLSQQAQPLLLHSTLAKHKPFSLAPLSHFSAVSCFLLNQSLSWDYLTAWTAFPPARALPVNVRTLQPFNARQSSIKEAGEGTRIHAGGSKGRWWALKLCLLCDLPCPPALSTVASAASLSPESLCLPNTINNALEQCDLWQAVSDDIVSRTQLLKQPGCNHHAVPTERHLANEIPFSLWSVPSM